MNGDANTAEELPAKDSKRGRGFAVPVLSLLGALFFLGCVVGVILSTRKETTSARDVASGAAKVSPATTADEKCSPVLDAQGCSSCRRSADNSTEICTACKDPKDKMVLDRDRCTNVCQGQVGCLSCQSASACDTCAPDYYEFPAGSKKCVAFDQVPGPKLLKFYNYRATDSETYPFGNADGASAQAVLGYLAHEVIGIINGTTQRPERKFGIDRIKRELIYVHNPPAVFLSNGGSQLGPWNPFDKAMCSSTKPPPGSDVGCVSRWDSFGFNVGCLPTPFCPACGPNAYYDFPGSCPLADYTSKNASCMAKWPGGMCPRPNGRRDCTWNYTDAGEIMLDDLEGINDTQWKNFAGFAAAKQCEFDKNPGGCKQAGLQGKGLSFWSLPNGVPSIDEPHAAQGRMQKLLQMFKEKFPQFEELPEPFSSVPGQVCG